MKHSSVGRPREIKKPATRLPHAGGAALTATLHVVHESAPATLAPRARIRGWRRWRRWLEQDGLAALLRLAPPTLRRAVYLRGLNFDPREVDGLVFKLAQTPLERERAFMTLHDAYVKRRIIEAQPTGSYTPSHAELPTTHLIVAKREEKVLGTLGLIEDSPLGLPMEATYPEAVQLQRERGRRIAEIGMLSLAPGERGKGAALYLYNYLYRFAHYARAIDDLLITVHPRMESFYTTILLFERIGEPRACANLKEAPAVALRLDLAGSRAAYFGAYSAKPPGPGVFDVIGFFDGPAPVGFRLPDSP